MPGRSRSSRKRGFRPNRPRRRNGGGAIFANTATSVMGYGFRFLSRIVARTRNHGASLLPRASRYAGARYGRGRRASRPGRPRAVAVLSRRRRRWRGGGGAAGPAPPARGGAAPAGGGQAPPGGEGGAGPPGWGGPPPPPPGPPPPVPPPKDQKKGPPQPPRPHRPDRPSRV